MHETLETTVVEFDAETGVGHVTLDRPESLNALSRQLRTDLVESLRLLEAQNDDAEGVALRAVVLDGADGNFCAGADVTEFSDESSAGTAERDHFRFLREFPVPIVAKIGGYCLGGGLETALSCDFRIAHEEARLGFPEVDLGLFPGAGGVQLLSRLATPSVAMELAMTGEHVSGERAAELGFVDRVYGDDLDDAVDEFAETIASKPPLAIQAIKDAARTAAHTGLEEGIAADQTRFEVLLASEDHAEGARAFAEDEYQPEFLGR